MPLRDAIARRLPPGSFAAHVATMATGTTLSQLIPFLVMPVLTRLYAPDDYALYGVFLSVAVPLSVLASGRYELAVMLPEKDEDAAPVVVLTLGLCFIGALVTLAGVFLGGGPFLRLLHGEPLGLWLYALPASILLGCSYQALNYWVSRRKRYRLVAASVVVQQAGTSAVAVGLGWFAALPQGLVGGYVAGQAAACGLLVLCLAREDAALFGRVGRRALRAAARAHWRFPAYNMPYSLVGSFSNRFPILILNAFRHADPAGYFSQCRGLIFAPATFVSGAIGQVFYREASAAWRTPRLERLASTIIRTLCETAAPAFAFLMIWGPDLFETLFGGNWREAGWYAAALAFPAYCYLFTSWPERIYEVGRSQHVSLLIQIVSDTATIGLLWILLAAGVAPLLCVLAYAGCSCLYHAAYLFAIFRIAGFGWETYVRLVTVSLILGGGFGTAFFGIRAAIPSPLAQMICGGLVLVLYYALWVLRRVR